MPYPRFTSRKFSVAWSDWDIAYTKKASALHWLNGGINISRNSLQFLLRTNIKYSAINKVRSIHHLLVRVLANIYPSRHSGCFGTTRQIHCVPEKAVSWYTIPYHASNHFARMNSNCYLLLFYWILEWRKSYFRIGRLYVFVFEFVLKQFSRVCVLFEFLLMYLLQGLVPFSHFSPYPSCPKLI